MPSSPQHSRFSSGTEAQHGTQRADPRSDDVNNSRTRQGDGKLQTGSLSRLRARNAQSESSTSVSSHQRRSQRNLQKPTDSSTHVETALPGSKEQLRASKRRELSVEATVANKLNSKLVANQNPSRRRNRDVDKRAGRPTGVPGATKRRSRSDNVIPENDASIGGQESQDPFLLIEELADEHQADTIGPGVVNPRTRRTLRAAAQSSQESHHTENADGNDHPDSMEGREQGIPPASLDPLSKYDLLGHTQDIIRAGRSARKTIRVAKANGAKPVLSDMKSLVRRLKKCTSNFTKLTANSASHVHESLGGQEEEEIGDLVSQVRTICESGEDRNATPAANNSKRSDLFLHLVPNLVRLLRQIVLFYSTHGDNSNPELRTGIKQLRVISTVTFAVLQAARFAKHIKTSQSGLPRGIITSTHSEIAAPLRAAHLAFLAHLLKHEDQLRQQAQNTVDEERFRYWSAVKPPLHQWRVLHEERRHAEGIYLAAHKQNHLAFVDPHIPELDSNGVCFERVRLFGSTRVHVGPSLMQLQKARDVQWSPDQVAALKAGLETFAGSNVFRNIFMTYCGRKGLLNRFNVTEIVTRAADLKEALSREARDSETSVPVWVQQIPVWTKPVAIGKENDNYVEA